MFEFVTRLFGSKTNTPAPADAQPLPAPMPPAAANENDGATSASEWLGDRVSSVLRGTFGSVDVVRYDGNGAPLTEKFIVKNARIESQGERSSHGFSGRAISINGENDNIQHGTRVSLHLGLNHPAEDYEKISRYKAFIQVMQRIPGVGEHLVTKPASAENPPTLGDIWAHLEPLLLKLQAEKKLSAHEFGMIKEYYAAHKGKPDAAEYWPAIEAHHYGERLTVSVNCQKLPGDETATEEPDVKINEWLAKHHDHILAKVKEKALASGAVKPGELDQLAMIASANGWNIGVHFGTPPAVTTDQQTGKPLTPEQLVEKMTKTPLANVNKDKLAKIFEEVLLEPGEGMEMPPFLPRILSGSILKDILHHRAPNDPAIDAVLKPFEMFKSVQDTKAEEQSNASQHKIVIEAPRVEKAHDGTPELVMDFELPPEMSVHQLMTNIANGKHVIQTGARPQAGSHAAGVKVANDLGASTGAGIAA
ncbi:MAG: hypothetical protein ACKVOE_10735 [Rickettsiales bacterium]